LALALVAAVGTRPDRIVAGFMIAAGAISMWVSNTATVLMLLPLVNSMLKRLHPDAAAETDAPSAASDFEKALLLGIAYAATIGGLGTLIGTPPNALLAGFLAQTHGVRVGFLDFMLVGVPLVILGIPITWFLLTRLVFRVRDDESALNSEALAAERQRLGPASRQEIFVGIVAVATAVTWIGQPWLSRVVPGLTEAGISVACALVLLVTPLDHKWTRVIDWQAAERIPGGVLVLFGGGLSLAAAIQDTGLAQWIGESLSGLRAFPPLVLILLITTVITFLGELTSNTATAAVFLPIASSLALGAGVSPLLLTVPAGLAASIGFMLPVGTPPNAIVFASGRLTIPQMVRAGFLLDIVFIILVTLVSYLLVLPVLG
jgi:sodium-dependent dicarboxylate transporter 2/3/5